MRKHALVLTAYKDFEFLKELCEVYSKYFYVYIHIDKKSNISESDMKYLNALDNVSAISRYKINWGSYLHVQAILDLLEMAEQDENDYVHVLSANTILVRHPNELLEFFEKYSEDIFMQVIHDDGNTFGQFGYRYYGYFFQHLYNARGSILGRGFSLIERFGGMAQAKIRIRRNVKFEWKGYVYCHMPIKAVQYILTYSKENPQYLQNIKYCYVGEEFFFQNILMNSEWGKRVKNNHLMYDIWSPERGNPAELTINDYEDIMKRKVFFARKVSGNNKELWEKIRSTEGF